MFALTSSASSGMHNTMRVNGGRTGHRSDLCLTGVSA
jgi:hypothetical protein